MGRYQKQLPDFFTPSVQDDIDMIAGIKGVEFEDVVRFAVYRLINQEYPTTPTDARAEQISAEQ